MFQTIQDLLKTLAPPLPDTGAVRRQGNAYALNSKGHICALSLSEIDVESLILDESATSLEHLYLNDNRALREVRFAVPLPKLRLLYLSRCALTTIEIPAGCSALEQVYVQGNQLIAITFQGDCPELELLDASNNQLTDFRLPAGFHKLAYMYLNDNQLRHLYFEAALPDLNILHLRNNQLNEVPALLVESQKMETLYLHGNPLEGMDKNVLEEGENASSWEGVRNYLLSFADGTEEYDQVKLIVLGNSTAGKSSLVYFLKDGEYEYNRNSTHGMVPVLWEIEDHLKVAIWDFGGQEYYHNIHHLFFTNKTLYAVLFEEKTNCQGVLPTRIQVYDQGEKVPVTENLEHFPYDYWLDNIRYQLRTDAGTEQMPDCFLIQNKIELAQQAPDKAADYHLSVEQSFEKNEDYSFAFEDFKRRLVKKLREIKGATPVSKKWILIKVKIQEEAQSGRPWLEKTEYEALAEKIKHGINDLHGNQQESELDTLTKTLHRAGIILYYPGIEAIKDKIFINPEWLTDSIYRVLDYKVQREKGRFTSAHVEEVIAEKHINGKHIKAVGLSATEIIALMYGFELIFEVNPALNKTTEPVYIAPQYLPVDCPEPGRIASLKEDVWQGAPPTFSLQYPSFIPKSAMPRFISRRGNLARNPCWKYGIQFVLEATEILVECDFNRRLIHVWIDNKPKKKELSKQIFDDFQAINDKNPDILISKNQQNWLKIGKLLHHNLENKRIEAENGAWLAIDDFSEFLDHDAQRIIQPMKKIFISYSKNDLSHLKELEKHLSVWKRGSLISVWNDQELVPGEKWDGKIRSELEEADIILFLVSADFLATDYIFDVEIKRAIERDNDPSDDVAVVPIIVRNCLWEDTPLAAYNTAPKKALIISNQQNIDDAWTATVKDLKKIIF